MELILAAIRRLDFVFAKTMPDLPHEYTMRRKARDLADYVLLFEAIHEHGVRERWRGRADPYLYPGDGWRYWPARRHTELVEGRRLPTHINRNRVEDAERLREAGLIR